MNDRLIEVKKALEEVMTEHNKIWGDIAIKGRKYYVPAGYNCFTVKDEDLYILAAGLIRKGLIK